MTDRREYSSERNLSDAAFSATTSPPPSSDTWREWTALIIEIMTEHPEYFQHVLLWRDEEKGYIPRSSKKKEE